MMRIVNVAIWCAAIALGVFVLAVATSASPTPYMGSLEGNGFVLTVVDEDVDTEWEVLSGAATFTPMASDTTLYAAFSCQSKLDSLRAGSAGSGSLTAVFTLGSTADASANNNFLQDRGTGTVSFVSAVFGDGASPEYNAYLSRQGDSDFNLGATWAIACFSRGLSAGNPGLGKEQTVVAVGNATHQARIAYTPEGYLTGIVTDDGGTTSDTLLFAADKYDSLWHSAVFSCASSTIRLKVDNHTASTTALSNATSTLSGANGIYIGASVAGANDFRGQVDEVYLVEDSYNLSAEMEPYLASRMRTSAGYEADSARVYISGLLASDSTRVHRSINVPITAAAADTVNLHAWEWAWLDSSEASPIIVYSDGSSPRSSLLDSIPVSRRDYPVAHAFFGENESPRIFSITFANTYNSQAGVWYEARVYGDNMRTINYDENYSVLCTAYISAGEPPATFDFGPSGRWMSPGTYLVIMGKSAAANADGSVTIVGQRRR